VRNRTVFGLTMLLAGFLGGAHEAQAGLQFCNQGKIKLSAAVGYVDRKKGWVAKGWIHIEPGECKDALRFPLDNRFYYYYASGRDEDSRIKITGENSFCIESRTFTIYQSDYGKSTPEECVKDGLRSVKFKKVDVQGKPEFTVNMGGPEIAPAAGADPAPSPPDRPAVATAPPPDVRQPPVTVQQPSGPVVRPPPAAEEESAPPPRRRARQEQPPPDMPAVRQPPASTEEEAYPPRRRARQEQPSAPYGQPPSASTEDEPPPRRRARQEQPPPNTPPAPSAAQGGGSNGAACQRFPNLC
jgi:uncharacterized membrane protein